MFGDDDFLDYDSPAAVKQRCIEKAMNSTMTETEVWDEFYSD